MEKPEQHKVAVDAESADAWISPEVKSFSPATAAEGISYQPGDGLFNLTP